MSAFAHALCFGEEAAQKFVFRVNEIGGRLPEIDGDDLRFVGVGARREVARSVASRRALEVAGQELLLEARLIVLA